jgi:hypothetical protein
MSGFTRASASVPGLALSACPCGQPQPPRPRASQSQNPCHRSRPAHPRRGTATSRVAAKPADPPNPPIPPNRSAPGQGSMSAHGCVSQHEGGALAGEGCAPSPTEPRARTLTKVPAAPLPPSSSDPSDPPPRLQHRRLASTRDCRANSGHVAWRTEPRNRNVAQHVQSSFTLHRFSGDDAEVLESEDWAALLMNQKRRFLRCRRTPRARCATPSAGPPARWRICKATSQCVYRDAATSDPALAADLETPEPRPSRSTADRKPRRDRDVDEDADAGEAVFRLPCGPGRLSSGWEVVWRRRPVAGRSAARDQPASNVGGLPGVEYRWLPQVGQWSAAARGSSVGGSPATRGF